METGRSTASSALQRPRDATRRGPRKTEVIPVSSAFLPRNRSTSLYSPETTHCTPKNGVAIPNDVVARSTAPDEIVGKVILVRAVAAQSELHVRLKKHVFVADRH